MKLMLTTAMLALAITPALAQVPMPRPRPTCVQVPALCAIEPKVSPVQYGQLCNGRPCPQECVTRCNGTTCTTSCYQR